MYKLIAPLVSLSLLAGIGVDKAMRESVPESVAAYHARVAAATERIPYQIGDWVGVDGEIRASALKILDPNVAMSRTYQNVTTGQSATLIVVHCADARDLLGHYPPVCYPSQGWTALDVAPHTIAAEDGAIFASEYSFAYDTLGTSTRLGVLHFTVLPDGRTAPNMDLLDRYARNRETRAYGGASIQFIVDANLPQADRDAIYETLAHAVSGWLNTIAIGADNEEPGAVELGVGP